MAVAQLKVLSGDREYVAAAFSDAAVAPIAGAMFERFYLLVLNCSKDAHGFVPPVWLVPLEGAECFTTGDATRGFAGKCGRAGA